MIPNIDYYMLSVSLSTELGDQKMEKCKFKGKESECPNACDKCAIGLKKKGDELFFLEENYGQALKYYKKALFLEPNRPELCYFVSESYQKTGDLKKALDYANKAIELCPRFLMAFASKGTTLDLMGRSDEAMEIVSEMLAINKLHIEASVLRHRLLKKGVPEKKPLSIAIEELTDTALKEVVKHHLDKDEEYQVIQEIYQKEEFAKSVFKYCTRCYAALGDEKVRAEACIKAFYGSLVITVLYYRNPESFRNQSAVQILMSSYDLERIENQAEKMLSIQGDEAKKEALWNVIYDFANYATDMAGKVWPEEDRDAAVLDAAESAYVMGMLYAMRWQEANAENNEPVAVDLPAQEPEQTVSQPKARFCHKCGAKLIEGTKLALDNPKEMM